MDTVVARWAQLEPHVHVVGPDDDKRRPAVLLFHGCGGLRAHLPRYAEAAKAAKTLSICEKKPLLEPGSPNIDWMRS